MKVLFEHWRKFIDESKEESVDAILEMAEYKDVGRCKALVVSGCLAQRYADQLAEEIPEVDYFLGTAEYAKISEVLEVKPGITGLWQISGRNNLSYQRRVELDSMYVNQLNFLLDIRIIIRTFGVIFFPRDRGSY